MNDFDSFSGCLYPAGPQKDKLLDEKKPIHPIIFDVEDGPSVEHQEPINAITPDVQDKPPEKKRGLIYTIELGDSATGNITRIDNALARLPEHLEEYQAKLADLGRQLESAKAEAAKPFAMEAALQRASARLAELDAALNLGGKGGKDAAA